MRDMTDIVKNIRKIVLNAINAQKLTDVVYGTVISTNPLKIQVDQKLILEEEQLKLTRAVRDYEVDMTVNHVTEETGNTNIELGAAQFEWHSHEYKGRKKFIIHNGLVVGDRVTMIRVHGGQQYIVIDKEVV